MAKETFTDDGEETTWTVPDGVTELTIEAWGAKGEDGDASATIDSTDEVESETYVGEGSGGSGGKAEATYEVEPGDTVTIRIGETGSDGGYPDGDDSPTASEDDGSGYTTEATGGTGGGSTVVEVEGNEIIRAGGGGGGGAVGVVFDGSEDDMSVDATDGDGGNANTGSGGDSSMTAENDSQFGSGTADASADGGNNGSGGNTNGGGDTDSVIDGNDQVSASGGAGGGGDSIGYGGGAEAVDDMPFAGAAGGGGSGTEYFDSDAFDTSTANNVSSPDNGIAGQVTIEYPEPPDPITDLTVSAGDREASLSWTNDPDDYDEIEVYRATESGGESTDDYTLVETVGGTDESYTDSDADTDGEEYFYRVRGIFGGNSVGWSGEDSGVTDLPAPTDLSVSNVGDESADLSWTDNANDGEVRVEYRPADESDWDEYSTVDRDDESETVDSLLNGEEYEARVIAVTDHAETEDN